MRARIVNQSRRAGRTPPRRAAARQSAGGRAASPRSGLLFHVPSFSIGLVLGATVVLITGYLPELLAPPPEPAGSTAGAGAKEATPQQPLRFEFDTILRTPPAPVTAQEPGTDPATGLLPDGTAPGMGATDPTGASSATAATESATPGVLDGQGPVPTTSMPLATDTGARPTTPQARSSETPISVVERPTGGGQAAEPPPPPAPAEAAPASAASYMLQAASFRSRADADRLRAELLLLDLPATTGEVNVGGSVWYRVTVGPFPDQPSADVARDRLRERNLTAIPFRR